MVGGITLPSLSGDALHRLMPLPDLELDKSRFEIVVAKYREDVAWIDCYPENVTVYSKDPGDVGLYPVIPNLGRDAGTQLYHIVERYNDLADRTLFLQGNPWDHPLLPIPQSARSNEPFQVGGIIESRMDWSPHWTKPNQKIDGAVMREFLSLIGGDPNVSRFYWTQGMQFAASRNHLHQRPRAYYQRIFDLSQRESIDLAGRRFDNHHIIFLLELFWRQVFVAPASAQ